MSSPLPQSTSGALLKGATKLRRTAKINKKNTTTTVTNIVTNDSKRSNNGSSFQTSSCLSCFSSAKASSRFVSVSLAITSIALILFLLSTTTLSAVITMTSSSFSHELSAVGASSQTSLSSSSASEEEESVMLMEEEDAAHDDDHDDNDHEVSIGDEKVKDINNRKVPLAKEGEVAVANFITWLRGGERINPKIPQRNNNDDKISGDVNHDGDAATRATTAKWSMMMMTAASSSLLNSAENKETLRYGTIIDCYRRGRQSDGDLKQRRRLMKTAMLTLMSDGDDDETHPNGNNHGGAKRRRGGGRGGSAKKKVSNGGGSVTNYHFNARAFGTVLQRIEAEVHHLLFSLVRGEKAREEGEGAGILDTSGGMNGADSTAITNTNAMTPNNNKNIKMKMMLMDIIQHTLLEGACLPLMPNPNKQQNAGYRRWDADKMKKREYKRERAAAQLSPSSSSPSASFQYPPHHPTIHRILDVYEAKVAMERKEEETEEAKEGATAFGRSRDDSSGSSAAVAVVRERASPPSHTQWLFDEWRLWQGELPLMLPQLASVTTKEKGKKTTARVREDEEVAVKGADSSASPLAPLSLSHDELFQFVTVGKHRMEGDDYDEHNSDDDDDSHKDRLNQANNHGNAKSRNLSFSSPRLGSPKHRRPQTTHNGMYRIDNVCIDVEDGTLIGFEMPKTSSTSITTTTTPLSSHVSRNNLLPLSSSSSSSSHRPPRRSQMYIGMPDGRNEEHDPQPFGPNDRMFHPLNHVAVPLVAPPLPLPHQQTTREFDRNHNHNHNQERDAKKMEKKRRRRSAMFRTVVKASIESWYRQNNKNKNYNLNSSSISTTDNRMQGAGRGVGGGGGGGGGAGRGGGGGVDMFFIDESPVMLHPLSSGADNNPGHMFHRFTSTLSAAKVLGVGQYVFTQESVSSDYSLSPCSAVCRMPYLFASSSSLSSQLLFSSSAAQHLLTQHTEDGIKNTAVESDVSSSSSLTSALSATMISNTTANTSATQTAEAVTMMKAALLLTKRVSRDVNAFAAIAALIALPPTLRTHDEEALVDNYYESLSLTSASPSPFVLLHRPTLYDLALLLDEIQKEEELMKNANDAKKKAEEKESSSNNKQKGDNRHLFADKASNSRADTTATTTTPQRLERLKKQLELLWSSPSLRANNGNGLPFDLAPSLEHVGLAPNTRRMNHPRIPHLFAAEAAETAATSHAWRAQYTPLLSSGAVAMRDDNSGDGDVEGEEEGGEGGLQSCEAYRCGGDGFDFSSSTSASPTSTSAMSSTSSADEDAIAMFYKQHKRCATPHIAIPITLHKRASVPIAALVDHYFTTTGGGSAQGGGGSSSSSSPSNSPTSPSHLRRPPPLSGRHREMLKRFLIPRLEGATRRNVAKKTQSELYVETFEKLNEAERKRLSLVLASSRKGITAATATTAAPEEDDPDAAAAAAPANVQEDKNANSNGNHAPPPPTTTTNVKTPPTTTIVAVPPATSTAREVQHRDDNENAGQTTPTGGGGGGSGNGRFSFFVDTANYPRIVWNSAVRSAHREAKRIKRDIVAARRRNQQQQQRSGHDTNQQQQKKTVRKDERDDAVAAGNFSSFDVAAADAILSQLELEIRRINRHEDVSDGQSSRKEKEGRRARSNDGGDSESGGELADIILVDEAQLLWKKKKKKNKQSPTLSPASSLPNPYSYLFIWRRRVVEAMSQTAVTAADDGGDGDENSFGRVPIHYSFSSSSSSSVSASFVAANSALYRSVPIKVLFGEYFEELFAVLLERLHAKHLREGERAVTTNSKKVNHDEAFPNSKISSSSSSQSQSPALPSSPPSPPPPPPPPKQRRQQLVCIKSLYATQVRFEPTTGLGWDVQHRGTLNSIVPSNCHARETLTTVYRAMWQRYGMCSSGTPNQMKTETVGRRAIDAAAAGKTNAILTEKRRGEDNKQEKGRENEPLTDTNRDAHPLFTLPRDERGRLRALYLKSAQQIEAILEDAHQAFVDITAAAAEMSSAGASSTQAAAKASASSSSSSASAAAVVVPLFPMEGVPHLSHHVSASFTDTRMRPVRGVVITATGEEKKGKGKDEYDQGEEEEERRRLRLLSVVEHSLLQKIHKVQDDYDKVLMGYLKRDSGRWKRKKEKGEGNENNKKQKLTMVKRTRGRPIQMIFTYRSAKRAFSHFRQIFSLLHSSAAAGGKRKGRRGRGGKRTATARLSEFIDLRITEGLDASGYTLSEGVWGEEGRGVAPRMKNINIINNKTVSSSFSSSDSHLPQTPRSRQMAAFLSTDILFGTHGADLHHMAYAKPSAFVVEMGMAGIDQGFTVNSGYFAPLAFGRNIGYHRVFIHRISTYPDPIAEKGLVDVGGGNGMRISHVGGQMLLTAGDYEQLLSTMVCSWLATNSVRLADEAKDELKKKQLQKTTVLDGRDDDDFDGGNSTSTAMQQTDFNFLVPWWCRGGSAGIVRNFLAKIASMKVSMPKTAKTAPKEVASVGKIARSNHGSNMNITFITSEAAERLRATAAAVLRPSYFTTRIVPTIFGFRVPYCPPLQGSVAVIQNEDFTTMMKQTGGGNDDQKQKKKKSQKQSSPPSSSQTHLVTTTTTSSSAPTVVFSPTSIDYSTLVDVQNRCAKGITLGTMGEELHVYASMFSAAKLKKMKGGRNAAGWLFAPKTKKFKNKAPYKLLPEEALFNSRVGGLQMLLESVFRVGHQHHHSHRQYEKQQNGRSAMFGGDGGFSPTAISRSSQLIARLILGGVGEIDLKKRGAALLSSPEALALAVDSSPSSEQQQRLGGEAEDNETLLLKKRLQQRRREVLITSTVAPQLAEVLEDAFAAASVGVGSTSSQNDPNLCLGHTRDTRKLLRFLIAQSTSNSTTNKASSPSSSSAKTHHPPHHHATMMCGRHKIMFSHGLFQVTPPNANNKENGEKPSSDEDAEATSATVSTTTAANNATPPPSSASPQQQGTVGAPATTPTATANDNAQVEAGGDVDGEEKDDDGGEKGGGGGEEGKDFALSHSSASSSTFSADEDEEEDDGPAIAVSHPDLLLAKQCVATMLQTLMTPSFFSFDSSSSVSIKDEGRERRNGVVHKHSILHRLPVDPLFKTVISSNLIVGGGEGGGRKGEHANHNDVRSSNHHQHPFVIQNPTIRRRVALWITQQFFRVSARPPTWARNAPPPVVGDEFSYGCNCSRWMPKP